MKPYAIIQPDEDVHEEQDEAAEGGADVVGHWEEELLGREVDEHRRMANDTTRTKRGSF